MLLGHDQNYLDLYFQMWSSPGKSWGYPGYKGLWSKQMKMGQCKCMLTRDKVVSLNLKFIIVITSQGLSMLTPTFSFELISYSSNWRSFVSICFRSISDTVIMILREKWLGSISIHMKFILFLLRWVT